MLIIGNLPSCWGAFTSRLLLYQIPSEVLAWSQSTPQTSLRICEAHSLAVNRHQRLGKFPIISMKSLSRHFPVMEQLVGKKSGFTDFTKMQVYN